MRSEVESLAERLRFLCCVNVQGLDPRNIRPFSKSSGRDGWLTVARALMEGRDEKVDAITAEVAALRGVLGEARVAVEMASRGEWPVDPHERKKYDALLARINTMFGEK